MTIAVHRVQAIDAEVTIGVGEYTLTGSGPREGGQILGKWGLTAVGHPAEIAMHISNGRLTRAKHEPAAAA